MHFFVLLEIFLENPPLLYTSVCFVRREKIVKVKMNCLC